jgi:hypothetical protein
LLELIRMQQPVGELGEVDLLEDEHCFLSVTYRCLWHSMVASLRISDKQEVHELAVKWSHDFFFLERAALLRFTGFDERYISIMYTDL